MKLLLFPVELDTTMLLWRPCVWLSKRQILVWLKHKTSNLTGGTINTAANVVNCNWPVIRAFLSDHMPIILKQNKHENLT